jgi:Homeodomain-like domain
MRLGDTCPTREVQEELLRAAGVEDFSREGPVYVDGPPKKKPKEGERPPTPQRDVLMQATRKGHEVLVAFEGLIGCTMDDTEETLAAMAEKGGTFVVASSGRRIEFVPEAAAGMRACSAARKQRAGWQAANARRNSNAHRKGGRMALNEKQRAEALLAWRNPKGGSETEIADRFGVSVSTLKRYFGPRDGSQPIPRRRRR